jgi:hypothetical protein
MIQTIYKINKGSIIEVSCTIAKRQVSNRGTRFEIIEILKSSGIVILSIQIDQKRALLIQYVIAIVH